MVGATMDRKQSRSRSLTPCPSFPARSGHYLDLPSSMRMFMLNKLWRGMPWPRVSTLGLIAMSIALTSVSCASEENAEPVPTFRITAPTEDIMRYMIDPSADAVWDAVVTVVTEEGIVSTVPETDEDWAELRRHAVILVESPNLLLMEGRRVAAVGSRSELPGVDLEPEEIEALLAEDSESWIRLVGELQLTGLLVLSAIDSQDVDELLVAGNQLDLACESCHIRYWYPSLAGP